MNAGFPPHTQPPVQRPTRHIPGWFWVLAVLGAGVLWVLNRVEPAGQFFYPRCWWFEMTGIQCPGCGATRATHSLLQGEWKRAFQLNALVPLGLPWCIWLSARGVYGWWTGRWWCNPLARPVTLAILTGLTLGYGLGRNWIP